ncbi:MAG: ImmA/IrrE family metallo-endopeptidase [Planctomycetes bacterium]|nr:ImmA/IrrE family metallo-endopeptidase [Planctomycetota bacterium]
MSGLDLEEAARKAQVKPPGRLEAWERGGGGLTIAKLRRLADVYKRPLALFYFNDPPPDEVLPADFRRADPLIGGAPSPELRLANREARSRREAALELLEDLGEQPPKFDLHATLAEDPEKVGSRLRRALTRDEEPPFADARALLNFWRTSAERLGALVFQARDVTWKEARGFSIAERPLPVVVLNIKDSVTARNFSLFHELTHLTIERGGLCLFDEEQPSPEARQVEAFCNRVAGAALVPAEMLLRERETPRTLVDEIPDDAVKAIARRYGVSPECALRRLVTVGRVSDRYYRKMRPEYERRYREEQEQVNDGGRAARGPAPAVKAVACAGRAFSRLVLEAYDAGRITGSDVADLFGERLKHLPRIRELAEHTTSATEEGE